MLVRVRRFVPSPLTLFAAAGVIAAVLAVLLVWTPASLAPDEYVFLPDTAHPLAPAVRVQGAKPAPPDKGGLYYVDVLERRATWIDKIFPPDGATFYSRKELLAPGTTDAAVRQQDLTMMAHSQRVAEYVATHAAGYDAKAIPTGVFVDDVYGNAPADGKLFPADIIVAVDGKPTLTENALRTAIRRHRVGSVVHFTIMRGPHKAPLEVAVKTVGDPRQGGAPVVGIVPEDDVKLSLPKKLKIAIDVGSVGGPSAGFAFTLQLLQELGVDVDRGHRIAATGTIAFDGTIGAIGGVKQKTIGARKAHADVFLVPVAGGNAAEAKRYAGGMRVIPVETFQQALRALATLPKKG
jgi:PDZ domain-containing protein